jgi:hypothetical protein
VNDDRLLDERTLRSALRLDADEHPPRLDLAAIRASAQRQARLSTPVMLVGSVSFAILTLGGVTAALRVLLGLASSIASGELLATVVAAITTLAERLELILTVVTQPAVPIAIVACLIVAFYYERRQAEVERTHA